MNATGQEVLVFLWLFSICGDVTYYVISNPTETTDKAIQKAIIATNLFDLIIFTILCFLLFK